LAIYDRDDPQWLSEKQFTNALAMIAADPDAHVVVIRSGATSSARGRAAAMVNATHVFLLTADQRELVSRIRKRDRNDALQTIAGVAKWFKQHDRRDGVPTFRGWDAIKEPDLGSFSEDW
jgi:predicted component of type VI protein secretion system